MPLRTTFRNMARHEVWYCVQICQDRTEVEQHVKSTYTYISRFGRAGGTYGDRWDLPYYQLWRRMIEIASKTILFKKCSDQTRLSKFVPNFSLCLSLPTLKLFRQACCSSAHEIRVSVTVVSFCPHQILILQHGRTPKHNRVINGSPQKSQNNRLLHPGIKWLACLLLMYWPVPGPRVVGRSENLEGGASSILVE